MKAPKAKHDRTVPRPWMGIFIASKGWIALIAAVVLLVLTLVSVKQYQLAGEFAEEGIEITAKILDRWIETDDDSDSYHMRFAYQPPGQSFRVSKSVRWRFYDDHADKTEAQIWYLPNRPGKIATYPGEFHDNARIFQFIALGAGIVGCFFLWLAGSRANRGVLARKRGQSMVATVTQIVERKSSGQPTGRGYMIWHTGKGIRGESLDHPIHKLRAIGVGGKINVYRRVEDTWWEGDVGPRGSVPRQLPKVPAHRLE